MLQFALSSRLIRLTGLTCVILLLIHIYRSQQVESTARYAAIKSPQLSSPQVSKREVTLVACHSPSSTRSNESIDWLQDSFPSWNVALYNMDDPSSVPASKGDEAMAYLTYIIDHYDNFLSPITIFHHASRYQWHSDDPAWDGRRLLRRLKLDYVKEQGYTSLRCFWKPGCLITYTQVPNSVAEVPTDHRLNINFVAAFKSTFPGEDVPDSVGHACCAEFAVTAETIRKRPRVTYERARNWLLETELEEGHLGRAFEYMWHILFNRPPVDCPNAKACYCRLFGLCGLNCEDEGYCTEQWRAPGLFGLPAGWPEFGLDGEKQDIEKLLSETEHIGQGHGPNT